MAKPLAKLVALLTPKRRWAQFSLKSLFVLVLVLAVPLWFLGSKMRERTAVTKIREFGAVVHYDWEWEQLTSRAIDPDPEPAGPKWLRSLLGDDFFAHAVFVQFRTRDDGVNDLLSSLKLEGSPSGTSRQHETSSIPLPLTDAGLGYLKALPGLKFLFLSGASITDVGLQHLQDADHLESLNLTNTPITDAGLVYLEGLANLEILNLSGTRITDAGLPHLVGLRKLQWLAVPNTTVTESGVAELESALPGCQISWWGAPRLRLPLRDSNSIREEN
jgi:hypothetical protein